jgi:hypothetical protein
MARIGVWEGPDLSTEPGEAAGWMVRTDAKIVAADGEALGGEA